MIIDGHSHVTFPVEEHIHRMNEAGIAKTVLFSTTFHPEKSQNTEEVKASMQYLNDLLAGKKGSMVEARKNATDELLAVIRKFPQYYIGFGAVPTGLGKKETTEYVEKNIKANNLAGMGEFTLGSGQVQLLEHVFSASAEFHNLPIWIHAFSPFGLQDIKDTGMLAKKYPDIPVILGHLGGTNWIKAMELATEIPNLYLDTSAYYSTFVLGTIINEIPGKCIFGVDRPFGDIELSKQTILKYAKTVSVANAVLGENMAEILKF